MAKQLQLRRGTTAQHATFTGAVGEVTIDTDKDVVVVHDGSTTGGFPLAKQSTTLSGYGITNAYTKTEVDSIASGKQATLVSGTNIKTINDTALLGSGNVAVQPTLVSGTNIKTVNSTSLLGSGNVAVQPTLVSGTNIKTINSNSLLGSGNVSIGVSGLSDTSISSPLSGQVLSYNGDNWENVTFSALDAATLVPTSYFDISQLVSGSVTTLNIPNIFAFVNTTFVNITSVSININATTYWDNSTYATPANRAGKDFYIYVLSDGTIKLSINSTYPTGSDANNSRKIGGFHTLCNSVGTISGHTLSGYVTGNILPRSVWDLYNRAVAGNEGMVKMPNGKWVDIYLPSWNGTKLVSVYGGTIADGASSPAFHCYKFEQKFGEIGKDTISQRNFVVASLGSNQSTNVTGSNDKGTTGGWTDTAGRRMISNIGCEDMCGLMWQWCSDTGGYTSGSSWANAFDGNDSGVGGQHYGAPYRGLLGGNWSAGAFCGSRGSIWGGSVLGLYSDWSARGCSEPSKNKLV